MKSIKLALLGFVSRKKLTLIILIQLTAVLCVLNILIASLNNRRMLLEPYEGIADQKGFYFNDALGEFENSDDLTSMLSSSARVFSIRQASAFLDSQEPFKLLVLPDEFYDSLRMPLADKSSETSPGAVIFRGHGNYKAGDAVPFTCYRIHNKFTVLGVLTDTSYVPDLTSFNYEDDIGLFYEQVSTDTTDTVYALMSERDYVRLGYDPSCCARQAGMIIYYPDAADSSDLEQDKALLDQIGMTRELEDIYSLSVKNLKETEKKYLPLALIVFFVVIVGVVFGMGIRTSGQLKNYAVYYIYGANSYDVFKINLLTDLVLILCSAILSALALFLFEAFGASAGFGLVFRLNNISASLLLIAAVLVMSAILPIGLIRRTRPAELLKEE